MRLAARSTYRAGNAWFVCDRCSQRWRRSQLVKEWTGLIVCPPCEDPRPPQMTPPNVYPEGQPFPDLRQPQDQGDLMQDDSTLHPGQGAMGVDVGGQFVLPSGQVQPVGAISPLTVEENPLVQGPDVKLEETSIRTGLVTPRDASDPTTAWPPVPPARVP